ncbi:leucyl aminopeptidase [Lewinella marina]|uniref:Leucyl aminopeptidase n=1 Tax=Neolewinella marina TaxID=438751 RepID=A0A2G0CD73_9BACT|nr:leucyl aminopeptidase family protein [Neolewinella marina]NJB86877.1 leucyl aminopeptidase [Neolewinella marina]PHK97924.1 leucyl aminopeptidase [Neolewinella marina]
MTQITLLPANGADDLTDAIPPDSYLRTLSPAGITARLPEDAAPAAARHLGQRLSHQEAKHLKDAVEVVADQVNPALAAAFLGGLQLGSYSAGQRKGDFSAHPLADTVPTLRPATPEAERELTLASVQNRVRALVDAPANKKRAQDLAAWAVDSGKAYGYAVKVLDKKACLDEGLHALLAVNRGSEDPAVLIVSEYRGAPDRQEVTAIIGKGITFDTGGVSIKGSQNLHLMKSDMGGAAATFGAVEAAARLQLPVNLVGIVPATDNSVDALSIKPSDVIESHAGKTIEIIDTDAEGRLVMADGLSYAVKHFNPTTLIDVATLTGSAVRTFGYVCAATLSKNEELVEQFRRAGDAAGERVWPLPPWDDFAKGLESDVADVKNFSGNPLHGATDAFKFLENFTHGHERYIHFDIAGVALKQGSFAKDRQATGFGVRLFVEWLRQQQ